MHHRRIIKEEHTFNEHGTFESLYAAEAWLSSKGYSTGSLDGLGQPVAIVKGEYNLPQKWHNFNAKEKTLVDGIITSSNWREGEVKITIYA